jgi:hypothetical protein
MLEIRVLSLREGGFDLFRQTIGVEQHRRVDSLAPIVFSRRAEGAARRVWIFPEERSSQIPTTK